MTLSIRSAGPDDAELVTCMIKLSMGELADYLFGVVNLSIDGILASLFLMKGNRFSLDATDVAEREGGAVGSLISFPGWEITRRNTMTGVGLFKLCGLLDFLRLAVRALSIAEGVESRRDEYYLADIAVTPDFQGRGIGSALLAYAERKAEGVGLKKCSLIVDTENPSARRLYERFGYHVVFTKTYPGPAGNAHAGYHRMVKELV